MAIQVLPAGLKVLSYGSLDLTKMWDNAPVLTDDLMIIVATRANTNIPDLTSSGWTQLFGGTVSRTNSSRTISIRVWWKFKQTLDATVTFPDIAQVSPPGRYWGYVVRGVDKSNPFDLTPDATSHIISGGGGSTVNPPAVTPVTSGAQPLYWMHDWSSSGYPNISWNAPFSQLPRMVGDLASGNKVFQRMGYPPNWTSGVVDGTVSGAFRDQWLVLALVTRPAGASAGGNIKTWNGSAFTAKPAKIWNGSAWVAKPVKRWNGTAWVTTTY
jgi:hypothetical protein